MTIRSHVRPDRISRPPNRVEQQRPGRYGQNRLCRAKRIKYLSWLDHTRTERAHDMVVTGDPDRQSTRKAQSEGGLAVQLPDRLVDLEERRHVVDPEAGECEELGMPRPPPKIEGQRPAGQRWHRPERPGQVMADELRHACPRTHSGPQLRPGREQPQQLGEAVFRLGAETGCLEQGCRPNLTFDGFGLERWSGVEPGDDLGEGAALGVEGCSSFGHAGDPERLDRPAGWR
jgi:hypothetical protein